MFFVLYMYVGDAFIDSFVYTLPGKIPHGRAIQEHFCVGMSLSNSVRTAKGYSVPRRRQADTQMVVRVNGIARITAYMVSF